MYQNIKFKATVQVLWKHSNRLLSFIVFKLRIKLLMFIYILIRKSWSPFSIPGMSTLTLSKSLWWPLEWRHRWVMATQPCLPPIHDLLTCGFIYRKFVSHFVINYYFSFKHRTFFFFFDISIFVLIISLLCTDSDLYSNLFLF